MDKVSDEGKLFIGGLEVDYSALARDAGRTGEW